LKAPYGAILDVRTSAHRPIMSRLRNIIEQSSVCCASVTKVTRSRQTVKLTLYHRTEALRALIYRRLIHRTEPNRPHISSDISISNSVETKRNKMRPKLVARPACNISVFSLAPRCRLPRFRFRPARLAPRRYSLAPPVRGVLRLVADTRNPFFEKNSNRQMQVGFTQVSAPTCTHHWQVVNPTLHLAINLQKPPDLSQTRA